MQKIGYKAVRIGNLSYTCLGAHVVHYVKDEWVIPAKFCGPLAVFTERKYAENWFASIPAREGNHGYILKCEYTPSVSKSLWAWKLKMEDGFPEGTDFADKVKII